MDSVREALACVGHGAGGSVLRDLFGYFTVPKRMSIRTQVQRLKDKHYHVNVIRVAPEDFPAGSTNQICYSLQITREVFGQVGLGIGRVLWFDISRDEAGSKAVIDSGGEGEDLTEDWTVPNDGLDLFVVRLINGSEGWSGVDGPCDKDSKGWTGSVVELYLDPTDSRDNDYAANGFAHEMGHYLGLDHIATSGNFIGGNGASDSWTGINASQGTTMKRHCLVRDGC